MHAVSFTHTQTYTFTYCTYWWRKTLWMSMGFSNDSKWCQQWNGLYVEQNVMTHKTIGVECGRSHFVVTYWGQVTGRERASESTSLGGGPSPLPLSSSVFLWKYISTPAFLFMPAPLLNAQGYWFCLNLSERSSSTFLVIPAFLASGIYLQKIQAPRQSSTLWYLRRMIAV